MKKISTILIIFTLMLASSSCVSKSAKIEVTDEIYNAVGQAVIESNKDTYLSGECAAEGHIIMGCEQDDDTIKVYALTMYGEYEFQDDFFVKISGSGVIPAVVSLKEDGEDMEFEEIEYPEDGNRNASSIKEMFPFKYRSRALEYSEEDIKVLTELQQKDARQYLKNINRDAHICDEADLIDKRKSLNDYIMNSDFEDKLDKDYGDYPDWIGSREKIENNIRYIYKTDYNDESNQIIYKKINYNTNEIVNEIHVDVITGKETKK